jgi:hypothetical protein
LDINQAAHVREGERPKQHGVHHAEHRRGCRHPDAEDDNGQGTGPGTPDDPAEGESEVVEHRVSRRYSCFSLASAGA